MRDAADEKLETRNQKRLLQLLWLGFCALIAQTYAVREALALTGGNEVVVGLIFGLWFLWSGVGALGARLALRRVDAVSASPGSPLLPGWLPLVQVLLIRLAAPWLENADGRLTSITQTLSALAIVLAPVPLLLGALLTTLASAFDARDGTAGSEGARRLAADSLGAALAGAALTFVFAGWLPTVEISIGIGAAGCALALWQVVRCERAGEAALPEYRGDHRRPGFWLWQAAIAAGLVLLLVNSARLDRWSLARRPRFASGQEQLLAARESRHQQLLLTSYRDQFTVYGDGEPLAVYPDRENAATEAHFAACLAPEPKRILLAGGAAGSFVRELLLHRPERIDLVEFDPAALALIIGKLAPADRDALAAPAVKLFWDDATRFLLAAEPESYDLIWLRTPAPSSLQTNRFYTREFYQRVARVLKPNGVLVFHTVGAPNYLSPLMYEYLGSIHSALREAFAVVKVLPGSQECFAAAKTDGALPSGPDEMVARFRTRCGAGGVGPASLPAGTEAGPTAFTPEVFHMLWEPDAVEKRQREYAESPIPPNGDLQPRAMLAYLRIWDRFASGQVSVEATRDSALRTQDFFWRWVPLLLALAMWLPPVFGRRSARAKRAVLIMVAALAGAVGIALELALLAAYQAACGYVYERLGLLAGLYLLGLAIGNWWAAHQGKRKKEKGKSEPSVEQPGWNSGGGDRRSDDAFFLYPFSFCLSSALLLSQCGLLLVTFVAWAFVGPLWNAWTPATVEWLVALLLVAYPVAAGAQLGLLIAASSNVTRGDQVGYVLAGDYAGAMLGAVATGTLLIPTLGVPLSVLLLCCCLGIGLVSLRLARV